jgi:hypothetical protein
LRSHSRSSTRTRDHRARPKPEHEIRSALAREVEAGWTLARQGARSHAPEGGSSIFVPRLPSQTKPTLVGASSRPGRGDCYLMIPVIIIRRLRESPRHFGRGRAVQLAPALQPAPLFVMIIDGKLMLRAGYLGPRARWSERSVRPRAAPRRGPRQIADPSGAGRDPGTACSWTKRLAVRRRRPYQVVFCKPPPTPDSSYGFDIKVISTIHASLFANSSAAAGTIR